VGLSTSVGAGVADRYRDLALAVRSILYNLGSEQWVDLLFECYGITDRDQTKIDFYILFGRILLVVDT